MCIPSPLASGSLALEDLPLFDADASASSNLNTLANAALANYRLSPPSASAPIADAGTKKGPSTGPGPFNPAAALPTRLVKKILDLEFVDMAEITADDDPSQNGSRPQHRLPVTRISQWLERFSLMAAILTTRFPEKAPEFFAYQAMIVRAKRNYEGNRWVSYDRQFRREALARKDLNWSLPDSRLYNEALTGRARAIPRCAFCLQDDHTAAYCPRNPNRPASGYGWAAEATPWLQPPQGNQHHKTYFGYRPTEVCCRLNEGRCRQPTCKYRHACSSCQGPHAWVNCRHNSMGRSRSPHNPPPQNAFTGQRF